MASFAITDVWSYNQSGDNLGTAWKEEVYPDEASWSTGGGLLYVEGSALPAPKTTPLTLGEITYYFRKHFTIDVDPATIDKFEINTVLDDGAIVYINGHAVRWIGMDPATTYDFDDLAGRNVDNAVYEGPFALPTTWLHQGDNVIAVEVHQATAGSGDVVFGLELTASAVTQNSPLLAAGQELIDGLRVSEIMYNPASDPAMEFVELTNISSTVTLDLTGVRLAGAVDFTFPDVKLLPGGRVVVVRDLEEFHSHYGSGVNVAGQYTGNLSDGGEELIVQLADPLEAAILRFDYNDAWYPATDGGGYALTIVDPAIDPADYGNAASWRAGTVLGGSPGRADGETLAAGVVINEVLSHTDLPQKDSIELRNVSAAPVSISGWYLSDSRDHLTKFRVPGVVGQPSEIILQPGQYIVFDEDDFNPGGGLDPLNFPNDFALDGPRATTCGSCGPTPRATRSARPTTRCSTAR